MNTTDQVQSRDGYSEKWQQRFAFFDEHGGPNSPTFKPAWLKLPLRQRIKINANIIAFFFGPIYLFVLGLWKKNLTLIGILLAVSVVAEIFYSATGFAYAKQLDLAIGIAINAFYARTTNFAYYLKEIKGEQGWNPFKGC
ncbi:DUF2628 domain-containing protein [Pseudomonas sp. W5-36]|uniref:DUF2628 domain-containing protein n=1 Tax=Pseudomonas sp. W5-36 TaxID=3097455 RepID=UPI00397AD077